MSVACITPNDTAEGSVALVGVDSSARMVDASPIENTAKMAINRIMLTSRVISGAASNPPQLQDGQKRKNDSSRSSMEERVTRFGCAHESRREAVKLVDHRKSKANLRIKVCGRLEYL